MQVILASHQSSMEHETGRNHPERPDRIPAVLRGIRASGVTIEDLAPEPASLDLISAVHDPDYIRSLDDFLAAGGGALDMDTRAGPGSWEAALRVAAAGPALCARLGEVGSGLGYVAMRPPGHHALADRAMGFCLFNNVAVTAAYLTAGGGRVAIVDWDVHHGNGTQDSFYADPNVLYLSIHQEGIYPGTGRVDEVGTAAGEGLNLNVPVPGGTGGDFYRRAVRDLLTPIVAEFGPDWLLVSAGYDGHAADPLASLRLLAPDYGYMAGVLSSLVEPGRSVIFLEGGYDLEALEAAAAATVRGWFGESFDAAPTDGIDPVAYLDRAREVAGRYWRLS